MLIAISGIDGSGKTLQVKLLEQWYLQQGIAVTVIKAYDEQAKMACRPFMESWNDDIAITFLFQALHAQQYSATMQALKRKEVVIADRWDESYLAYHQNFCELSARPELREVLNKLAFRNKLPDEGFLIEVPPSIAKKRRTSRGKIERFENRPDNFFRIIQDAYRVIAHQRKWHILDGTKTPQEIHERLVEILLQCKLR